MTMVPLSQNDLSGIRAIEADRRATYTAEAPVYDARRYTTFGQQLVKQLLDETLLNLLEPRPGVRILDVATGTGRASVELARHGATVVGVDLTEAMLREQLTKRADLKLRNLHLQRASARQLPYRDGTFDSVVSLRFLHLVPFEFQREFVDEMLRVLRPGGRLVVSFNNPSYLGGKGFVEYLRARARGQRLYRAYLWPNEEARLFRGIQIETRVGSWFPGISQVGRLNSRAGLAYGRLERVPLLNRLCEQILVVCRKQH